MDITPYISLLMLDHDCVIVPGFGGFVLNYRPAQIHHHEQTIEPPRRNILFNRSLNTNDGLLTDFISRQLNISFAEAADTIRHWVFATEALLRQSTQVELPRIGTFSLQQDRVQFQPVENFNYYKPAFGLPVVPARPLAREVVMPVNSVAEPVVVAEEKKFPWLRVAAVIIPLMVLAGLFTAKFFPFTNTPSHADTASVASVIVPSTELTASEANTTEEAIAPTESLPAVEIVAETPSAIEAVSAEVSAPITETNEPGYYIITGAFLEEKNIENMRQNLASSEPGAEIISEKGIRLTKVGYLASHNFREALRKLEVARATQEDCWLYTKK